jgi:hypothetical protein
LFVDVFEEDDEEEEKEEEEEVLARSECTWSGQSTRKEMPAKRTTPQKWSPPNRLCNLMPPGFVRVCVCVEGG